MFSTIPAKLRLPARIVCKGCWSSCLSTVWCYTNWIWKYSTATSILLPIINIWRYILLRSREYNYFNVDSVAHPYLDPHMTHFRHLTKMRSLSHLKLVRVGPPWRVSQATLTMPSTPVDNPQVPGDSAWVMGRSSIPWPRHWPERSAIGRLYNIRVQVFNRAEPVKLNDPPWLWGPCPQLCWRSTTMLTCLSCTIPKPTIIN